VPENAYEKVTQLLNLTSSKHLLSLAPPGGRACNIPGGHTVRLATDRITVGDIQGVPVVMHTNPELKGMPKHLEDDIVYITSGVVAKHIARWNVVSPDTSAGNCIRDHYGQITATRQLIAYARRVA